MSVTSGGTAPNPFSMSGRSSALAGSAGMVMTLRTAQRSFSRYQVQIDDERSFRLITQLTKP
jgi:hypothetical protein